MGLAIMMMGLGEGMVAMACGAAEVMMVMMKTIDMGV